MSGKGWTIMGGGGGLYVGLLFAQEAAPTVTGAGIAGWSSFGLAGLILAWLLLKHLPDKDKQIKEMLGDHRDAITEKDGQIKELLSSHKASLEAKDGQIQRMLDAKNEQIKVLTSSGTEQIKMMVQGASDQMKVMHADNRGSLDRIMAHCEAETAKSNEILLHDLRLLTDEIKELGESIRDLKSSDRQSQNVVPRPGWKPRKRPGEQEEPPTGT